MKQNFNKLFNRILKEHESLLQTTTDVESPIDKTQKELKDCADSLDKILKIASAKIKEKIDDIGDWSNSYDDGL